MHSVMLEGGEERQGPGKERKGKEGKGNDKEIEQEKKQGTLEKKGKEAT